MIAQAIPSPHPFNRPLHGFASLQALRAHLESAHGMEARRYRYVEEMRHVDAHRTDA